MCNKQKQNRKREKEKERRKERKMSSKVFYPTKPTKTELPRNALLQPQKIPPPSKNPIGYYQFMWAFGFCVVVSVRVFQREKTGEGTYLSVSLFFLSAITPPLFLYLPLHICLPFYLNSLCFLFSLFEVFILLSILGDTMKKMKRVVLDSSPSYVFDEEAKNRFKHQSLMQDFNELEKETEEVKKKLQKAKRKKLRLLAEVRFLRRRYKYLLKNPSQKTPSERLVQPKLPNIRNQSSLKERNYREMEASIKRTPAIDLNQISRGEETEEFVWEPPRMDKKLERPSAEGGASAGDLKWVCRDVGNGPSRSGKRKISWQDQVALRV